MHLWFNNVDAAELCIADLTLTAANVVHGTKAGHHRIENPLKDLITIFE